MGQDEEIRVREELVQLKEEEETRSRQDLKKSAAYVQKEQEVEALTASLAQSAEENKILVEQASDLRSIITEKQFLKDAVVDQCRQIQMQTTMLLINAGRYDSPKENKAEKRPAAVESSKKRKSLVEHVDEKNTQRAAEQAAMQKRIQREKCEILQMVLSILQAHERTNENTALSMAALSSQIKFTTGKGWGGHWGKRHGTLLQFLQQHKEIFDANFRSGVTLRF